MASAQVDVVGVYDSGFNQLFPLARPVRATVKESAKVMEHPVESGATVTDFFVVQPVEIELSLILTGEGARDVYQQIKSQFKSGGLLTVQTRAGIYSNMLIASIPHDEAADTPDRVDLALTLREAELITAKYAPITPQKPKHSSTVKRGEQQATTAPPAQKGSAAFDLFFGKGK